MTYVRNFTDVDDKINARAAESGRSIGDITQETIGWYLDDMAALGALEPDLAPRATQSIEAMIAMIAELIEKGHAYAAEGHVLFSVASDPQYGSLSHRNVDDMIAGARVEVAPYKRDAMDFVLWKPSDADTPGWESPWGRGRPGWHIECSAMSREVFGERFDIHGGGNDLMFPHHENEAAQSRCAHGHDGMASIWMHNGMLQVEGAKMSKSLGNFFTVKDLLDQGIPGEVIRFVLLSTHYRKPLDWTERRVAEYKWTLGRWYDLTDRVEIASEIPEEIVSALADDLNVPAVVGMLHGFVTSKRFSDLKATLKFLGFGVSEEVEWYRDLPFATGTDGGNHTSIAPFLKRWQELRNQKEYQKADALKAALEATGLELKIDKTGPHAKVLSNFELSKLEALK